MRRLATSAAIVAMLSSCTSSRQAAERPRISAPDVRADERAIRRVFADYKAAIVAKDGTTATSLLSDASLAWYQEILELARSADRRRLFGATGAQQVHVLLARSMFDRTELDALDAGTLFAALVAGDPLQGALIGTLELKTLAVNSEERWAECTVVNSAALDDEGTLRFVNERGWKLDLSPLQQRLEQEFSDLPSDDDERERALLELVTEYPPDPTLLDGPRPPNPR